MTMQMEDVMHGLTNRAAADGVIVTIGGTMGWWLDALHGPAQELAFWGTVALVVGRLVLLALDVRDRLRRPGKVFTREQFDDPRR
ncbi:hypothetical protein VY88_03170 [Azospirillum thiophilum]|uniref:Uncharacterized protein n=1 Tax=Azospirillum thiophilum TaxID=528244 RepID=A0AAC8VXH5_9PROT|nr:hypothetical protein [Azospirillum thiophilum]ALG71117.1 hypothetical protein AL072_09535 [Azospirillum thiophilum]KJR65224.1 hypothetical protein VY88_03170 [Azospirillum thiophilum]